MEKMICINQNNKIIIKVTDDLIEKINISQAYMKDNIITKIINLSIDDDIYFVAESYEENTKSIDFEFEINNPLYFSLNRLLGLEDSMIIDDDHTSEKLERYIEIYRKDNTINISFYNKSLKQKDNYSVFIKNILSDGRSKIIDYNIKLKLKRFFNEAKEMLLKEHHQYTLDEYYEIIKSKSNLNKENPFLKNTFNKVKNPGECCRNCEFAISSELIDDIISENQEYRNMEYDIAIQKIGNCEYEISLNEQIENDYWCQHYEPNEQYKLLLKR